MFLTKSPNIIIKFTMNNGYIGVMDSGVGGISTLAELIKAMPNEKYLYFGDNKNAPYGNKTQRELISLAMRNYYFLESFGLKAIVAACNTLSVAALKYLRDVSSVPVFGVFPPVEKAVLSGGRTLLLATPRTVERYTDCFSAHSCFYAVALPRLAIDIENNAGRLDDIDVDGEISSEMRKNGLSRFDVKGAFDTVISGCTHYSFVENKIFNHFKPKILSNGNFYTVKTVTEKLKYAKSSVKHKRFELRFVGDNACFNENFFNKVVNRARFLC